MSLLLDTHVVLWWLMDSPALPDDLAARLADEPDVYISSATVWEAGIKQSIGKLTGPTEVSDVIVSSGFRELAVTSEHASTAGRLPLLHRDPFDRMLVAQARCEHLTLVSRDPWARLYDVDLLSF